MKEIAVTNMCLKFTSRLKILFCDSSLKISVSQSGIRLEDDLVCVMVLAVVGAGGVHVGVKCP